MSGDIDATANAPVAAIIVAISKAATLRLIVVIGSLPLSLSSSPVLMRNQYRTEGMNAPLGSLYRPRLIRFIG